MNTTKSLYLLVVIQTILVVVLYIKVDGFESGLETTPAALPAQPEAVEEIVGDSTVAATSLDAGVVRRIVREELRNAGVFAAAEPELPEESFEMQVYDQVDLEYRRGLIIDEMELMKQEEEVSTADLNRLLSEISSLDPERRSELLAMLNAAMNRGEIRGRL